MRTTDILIITLISIWLVCLIIFGLLAFIQQDKVNKIKIAKKDYEINNVVVKTVELDFKLPEGEVCFLHLKNQKAKFIKTKKSIVESTDKFYVMNPWKVTKSNKDIVDLYFTNKNIVITSKINSYKLAINGATVVKPGVKYLNKKFIHETIIKLDYNLYFLIEDDGNDIYKTYEMILKG
ncbi:hypothetical protein [Spiroplasma endosymbiont of Othius punctulatus]|uniref:hypothetical protein n=1 Tax=Spiroplasma endosymbiont of Othius punctulatus TaxID=3066289 RepID=UPI0030D1FA85